ncbi:hypothetical protein L2E82_33102 [Cichorium intybus]|uniref:Uncharacterized protein n=1 Tax=Cichorium intybus TaxID=13427 RepID=A0ACB9BJ97_CICIN|nr:hypothetical protein L2E82_33102 [Cichorium intybus]
MEPSKMNTAILWNKELARLWKWATQDAVCSIATNGFLFLTYESPTLLATSFTLEVILDHFTPGAAELLSMLLLVKLDFGSSLVSSWLNVSSLLDTQKLDAIILLLSITSLCFVPSQVDKRALLSRWSVGMHLEGRRTEAIKS